MSNETEENAGKTQVSRRKLLGKAALVVGGAAAAGVTAGAFARPSDVVIDSSGKVTVGGNAFAQSGEPRAERNVNVCCNRQAVRKRDPKTGRSFNLCCDKTGGGGMKGKK